MGYFFKYCIGKVCHKKQYAEEKNNRVKNVGFPSSDLLVERIIRTYEMRFEI